MEADKDVPIIFGRPFLSTCDSLVKVRLGRPTLRLGEERVIFKLSDTIKPPALFSFFNFIETTDTLDNY